MENPEHKETLMDVDGNVIDLEAIGQHMVEFMRSKGYTDEETLRVCDRILSEDSGAGSRVEG